MNHYERLEISNSATPQQIKKSYKKLALKHHPDKNLSNRDHAKQKFTKISQAYSILSDPIKRRDYDNSLLNNKNNFGAKQYNWKNPEFDPSYNHFGNTQRYSTPKVYQNDKNQFVNYNFDFKFPSIRRNYMDVPFGDFTFQMAEQIFNQVFSEWDKNPEIQNFINPMKSLMNTNSYTPPQNMVKKYSEPYSYKPQNSSLISQKTIQRNGKKVLIKKYSINQNGYSRTQTHEQIVN